MLRLVNPAAFSPRITAHLILAALPLLAITAHVAGLVPMHLSAGLLIIPAALFLTCLGKFAPIPEDRVITVGICWGIAATAVYDLVRLDTVALLGLWGDFIPTMGTWLLDLDPDQRVLGGVAGYVWRYAGDGGGLGLVFTVLAAATGLRRLGRRMTVTAAVLFAVIPTWGGLIATVGLTRHGQQLLFPLTATTVALSLLGHVVFGLVLGLGISRCPVDLEAHWTRPRLIDLPALDGLPEPPPTPRGALSAAIPQPRGLLSAVETTTALPPVPQLPATVGTGGSAPAAAFATATGTTPTAGAVGVTAGGVSAFRDSYPRSATTASSVARRVDARPGLLEDPAAPAPSRAGGASLPFGFHPGPATGAVALADPPPRIAGASPGAALTEDLGAPIPDGDGRGAPGTALVPALPPPAESSPRRVSWPVALLAGTAVVAPMVLSALSPTNPGGVKEFSTQAGVLATALLVVGFVVVSRSRRLSRALGMERLLGLHRLLGGTCVAAVAAHVVVVVANSPRGFGLLNPSTASPGTLAGIVATAALALTAVVFTRPLARLLRHRTRRGLHVLAAAVVLVASGLHILWMHTLVSSPQGRVWTVGLSVVLVGVVAVRWAWRPLRRPALLVYDVHPETPTITTLILVPGHGDDHRLRFEAGQFVWLRLSRLALPAGEHPFTIASSALQRRYLELTITAAGSFSRRLAALTPGQRVWLDGPHGAFTGIDTPADGLVLIGGGSGLAPMLAMLRTLADQADTRSHWLIASAPEHPYADDLDDLQDQLHLDLTWLDGRWVDPALLDDVLPPTGRGRLRYFVCGPEALITNTVAALRRIDVEPDLVTTERY